MATSNDNEVLTHKDIQTAISIAVLDLLQDFPNKPIIPGWPYLFSLGLEIEKHSDRNIPILGSSQIAQAVDDARTDPDAYDGLCYVVSRYILLQKSLPNSARVFAAEVIEGSFVRPTRKGRKRATDLTPLKDAYKYSMALLVRSRAKIPLSRNESTEDTLNACDVVSVAWTNAGEFTTFDHVKALCYNKSYSNVRALGHLIGDSRRVFSDLEREMDFSDIF